MLEYESLLTQATQLPISQRVQLIEAIWDTVPADEIPPLNEEWLAEIERRSAEIDAGSVKTIPWEQVRAEALQRAGTDDTR